MTTKEMYVFMLTIGKIIEENLPSLIIAWICARIGTQKTLSHHIKMGAAWNTGARIAMDGRSKNFTQITSN
jgi:hypothetical protein